MSDQRVISFQPDPKVARAVEAERKRLLALRAKGSHVGKAEAVRSLIIKASTVEEKADA